MKYQLMVDPTPMGDLKFTTAGDYIYPGSDPQE